MLNFASGCVPEKYYLKLKEFLPALALDKTYT
jgi:hypothetical protein